MLFRRSSFLPCLLAGGCVLAAGAGTAHAQTIAYPTRAVRVIVPFPPGAGVDLVTRIVVPRISESVGQPFVIENRAGAGGIVGTELAARAPADGYTLYAGGSALVISPLLSKVSYSTRDFAALSRMASVPFVLVVHPSLPARSLKELIALARAKPGAINYASTGIGTTPHLSAELFKRVAGIDITHVPYKGSAPALTDLLGGHVEMFFCNMLSAIPLVSSGKLRPLGVTSLQRSPVTPRVPTIAESGFPNFETATWFGLLAPNGVSEQIVAKLHGETVKALRRADVQQDLASQGATPTIDRSPADTAAYVRAESEKWGKVIKSLAIKTD